MIRCPCSPCPFILLFLSPCPLSSALPDLLASACSPALRVVGGAGLLSICGCWRRVGLLACHRPRAALSLAARSLFSRRSAVGCVYRSAVACFVSCVIVGVGCRRCCSRLVVAASARRLCHRVILYSIPDEMMRITGSCCIRLVFACLPVVVFVSWGDVGLSPADVVPPLVPSGGSPLVPACLMFAAVCLDASPRHLIISCLTVCRSCVVPRLVPLPA